MKTKLLSLLTAIVLVGTSNAANTLTVDCGSQAQINAIAETGYHFVRWNDGNTDNPRIISPTEDATYTAFFAINQYTITFRNYNDTVLQTAVYNHGDAVTAPTAVREADVQYTYTFDHWSPNISYTATEDVEYKAVFTSTLNKYTITFKNWDGTVLESKQWEYGTLPTYEATPTKPADAENTYVFSGWDKVVSVVEGDAEYVAQYSSTTNSYAIYTTGENGTTEGDGTYLYGTEVELKATANACYRFVRWNDGNTEATRTITVVGEATYVAVFEKITYTITVESDNEEQGSVSITAYP